MKNFRVLVIDTNPILPISAAVAEALDRLSDRLVKTGAKVARKTELLPDWTEMTRTFTLLLYSFVSYGRSPVHSPEMEPARA